MTDRSEQPVAEEISFVLSVTAGVISLVFGLLLLRAILAQLFTPGSLLRLLPAAGFCLVSLSLGAVLVPPIRRRLADRHGIGTFGRLRTVDRRLLRDSEVADCVVCGDTVKEGVIRRYRDEFVLAGVPIVRWRSDRNHYCPNCVGADRRSTANSAHHDPASQPDSDTHHEPRERNRE